MNSNVIKIIIADDHPVLLSGLYEQLLSQGFQVIYQADNGADALDKIVKLKPHLAILDLEMPVMGGFEIIKKAHAENINTKFIAYTYHKERRFVLQANKLNIAGYILKNEPYEELTKAIQKIMAGGTYFSQEFTDIYQHQVFPEVQKINSLSPSERTILRNVASKKSSQEIADELGLSIRTVQKHRTNIIKKMGLSTYVDSLHDWIDEYKDLILSL